MTVLSCYGSPCRIARSLRLAAAASVTLFVSNPASAILPVYGDTNNYLSFGIGVTSTYHAFVSPEFDFRDPSYTGTETPSGFDYYAPHFSGAKHETGAAAAYFERDISKISTEPGEGGFYDTDLSFKFAVAASAWAPAYSGGAAEFFERPGPGGLLLAKIAGIVSSPASPIRISLNSQAFALDLPTPQYDLRSYTNLILKGEVLNWQSDPYRGGANPFFDLSLTCDTYNSIPNHEGNLKPTCKMEVLGLDGKSAEGWSDWNGLDGQWDGSQSFSNSIYLNEGEIFQLSLRRLDVKSYANFNFVPEPAIWATLTTGFGLVGGMLRRKRKVAEI